MRPFAYARADDLDQALAAVSDGTATVLAGGTELLNWMRLDLVAPARVVDITGVGELLESTPLADGGLRLGALTPLNRVAADPRVGSHWPVLRQAIDQAASPQLRNLATLGGNLLQKPRCAYLRAEHPLPCNRREAGSGCAALAGRNEHHAIFGWTDACVATLPSDPAVALTAVDAVAVTRRGRGGRRIPVSQLHLLPGDRVDVDVDAVLEEAVLEDTVLERGELIVAVELPAPAPRSAYVKVRGRTSYEFALVSCGATVELDGDVVVAARIALGSVAMRPWRLLGAEEALKGLPVDSPLVLEVLDAAMAEAQPLEHNAYKVGLARNAAWRALRLAAAVPVEGPRR